MERRAKKNVRTKFPFFLLGSSHFISLLLCCFAKERAFRWEAGLPSKRSLKILKQKRNSEHCAVVAAYRTCIAMCQQNYPTLILLEHLLEPYLLFRDENIRSVSYQGSKASLSIFFSLLLHLNFLSCAAHCTLSLRVPRVATINCTHL